MSSYILGALPILTLLLHAVREPPYVMLLFTTDMRDTYFRYAVRGCGCWASSG